MNKTETSTKRKSIKEPKRNSGGENLIMEMKNSLEVFKGRFEWTKKKKKKSLTSKLRDRVMEIIKFKKQK